MNFEQPSEKAETREIGKFTLEKLSREIGAMEEELNFLENNPNPSEVGEAFIRLANERLGMYKNEVDRRSRLN